MAGKGRIVPSTGSPEARHFAKKAKPKPKTGQAANRRRKRVAQNMRR